MENIGKDDLLALKGIMNVLGEELGSIDSMTDSSSPVSMMPAHRVNVNKVISNTGIPAGPHGSVGGAVNLPPPTQNPHVVADAITQLNELQGNISNRLPLPPAQRIPTDLTKREDNNQLEFPFVGKSGVNANDALSSILKRLDSLLHELKKANKTLEKIDVNTTKKTRKTRKTTTSGTEHGTTKNKTGAITVGTGESNQDTEGANKVCEGGSEARTGQTSEHPQVTDKKIDDGKPSVEDATGTNESGHDSSEIDGGESSTTGEIKKN